jgi:hypothetical protein
VLGSSLSDWVLPSVPAAGAQSGGFVVPPVGSRVWIEFEGGDPESPIWSGGFRADSSEVPVLASIPPPIPNGKSAVLLMNGRTTLVLSDAPPCPVAGGILLESPGGATTDLLGPTVLINGKLVE